MGKTASDARDVLILAQTHPCGISRAHYLLFRWIEHGDVLQMPGNYIVTNNRRRISSLSLIRSRSLTCTLIIGNQPLTLAIAPLRIELNAWRRIIAHFQVEDLYERGARGSQKFIGLILCRTTTLGEKLANRISACNFVPTPFALHLKAPCSWSLGDRQLAFIYRRLIIPTSMTNSWCNIDPENGSMGYSIPM